MPNALKVKLVAIAKDEAAYLPEWIFHHLHFGFDAIDIYVNNTSDNTEELAVALKNNEAVNFLDGEKFFDGTSEVPQRDAYIAAYDEARNSEYTHVMYLDIDEFWTPLDFKTTVHECLAEINADVISFEWFLHMHEKDSFSTTFKEQVKGRKGFLVKSLVKTNMQLRALNPHNVNIKGADYRLADGSAFKFKIGESHKVNPEEELKSFFITHRMYRSEMEYTSLLLSGRGAKLTSGSIFKNNRNGYYKNTQINKSFLVDKDTLTDYHSKYDSFLNTYQLDDILSRARLFVKQRYNRALLSIESAPLSELDTINKVFKNISLDEVKLAITAYKNKIDKMLCLLPNRNEDNKVKLVAIAKDEAAYIPEWVHHHLFVGFDEIEIFINRTSDNSEQVLNAINAQYPNVTWDYADWIDSCPLEAHKHIQFITYANAKYQCQKEGKYSHIFFLDIDEFLILDELTTSIHDLIKRFPADTPIAFEWLNDCTPMAEAFSKIPPTLTGNLSPLVKTLLPVDIEIKEFRHHLPLFKEQVNTMLVDHSLFKSQEKVKQALDSSVNSLKTSFIYHRAHRSQYEYVSLLYRGRPGDTFAYKSNRRGYPQLTRKSCSVKLNEKAYFEYQSSFKSFVNVLAINELSAGAEQYVCERYKASIDNLHKHLLQDYPLMVRLFSGVFDEQVTSAFKSHRAELIKADPENIELLINLSNDAQKQDIDEAIEIILLAKKIRPKGPLINKKLKQFLQFQQESVRK
ncbi:glycosyltransferase family 2 protein [Pseudoalteromonas agarivorans]|uniref:glycosyltransferase family 2 protein n=1 Tax=Pseudoalteromonas agarivorans TaxID=176102 RepID=UPI0021177268|nr:glycosyltransferase family 2 protein [Pseudoalteromonas agarivorans]MCQ8886186.1 glycosyltransferase family 2 protein [Pseudoalteromonas agarivorans]